MTPEELMKVYPFLDEMLASTLLKMSEQGKLEGYFTDRKDAPETAGQTIVGAIQVEEKSSMSTINGAGQRLKVDLH